jgi:hypothetical protein
MAVALTAFLGFMTAVPLTLAAQESLPIDNDNKHSDHSFESKTAPPVYYYIDPDPFASLDDIMHLVCPLYPAATSIRVGEYLYDLNPGKLQIFPLFYAIKTDNQFNPTILVIGCLPNKDYSQCGTSFYIVTKVNRQLKIAASLDEIYPEPIGKIRLLDEPVFSYIYDHDNEYMFALGFYNNAVGNKGGAREEEVIWYRIINGRITEVFRYEKELYEHYYDGFHDRQSYSTLDIDSTNNVHAVFVMYTVSYILPNDDVSLKPVIKKYNCTWNGKYYEKIEVSE